MNDALLLIVMILATFRLTWLLTRDTFPPIRAAREWFVLRARDTGEEVKVDEDGYLDPRGAYVERRGGLVWLADLVTCYWCVSVWVAAGVTLLVWALVPLPLPLLWFGAVAGGGAFLAKLADGGS